MKRSAKILSLSAAALLVVVVSIILIRRRGRKVYLKDKYRLNRNYQIWIHPESDWFNYLYYEGTLDYVIVPHNAEETSSDGKEYIQITGIGELQSDDRIRRNIFSRKKGKFFIEKNYLNL